MDNSESLNSLYAGKKAWNNMLRNKKIENLLTEEVDTMGGSDIPATQPLGSGEKPKTMASTKDTITAAAETPEYKKIKKDLELAITNSKKDYVTQLARKFKNADTESFTLEDFIAELNDWKAVLEADKSKLNNILAASINDYNTKVDTGISHALKGMGLAVERMKLPEVKNIEDFRNIAIFFGNYDNLMDDVASLIKSISQKNVLGQTVQEAFTGKRNVQRVDDPTSSLEKIRDRIPNKLVSAIKTAGLIDHLKKAFLATAKIEILDAIIKGFDQKLQRLHASKSAKDTAQAKKDAELIVLDPADFGVSVDTPVEEIKESKKPIHAGPGRIAQIEEEKDNILDAKFDKQNKNKTILKESWNKVAQRNSKSSKDIKPDDFIMILG